MKRNIYILFIIISGILISCNDFLDTMPDDRAELNTVDKITAMLVSAYPTNSPQLITEMSSDNAMDNGPLYTPYNQEQEDSYLWKDITTTGNDSPNAIWNAHYRAVASANQALQAIEDLGDLEVLQGQKGEALIARAYAHFALSNVFCLAYNPERADIDFGIPYSEKPETQVIVMYERGTMNELYEKIDADIKAGFPLIDDNLYKVPKYHFNKKAAAAFAARFYLYYQKLDEAIKYADLALGDMPEKLINKWSEMYGLASNFSLRSDRYISSSDPGNFLITPAISSAPYVFGPYSIGQRYGHARPITMNESIRAIALWGAHAKLCMGAAMWGFDQKLCAPKVGAYFEYTDKVAGIGYLHSVPVSFTAAETLLVRAEAKLLKNNLDGGVSDINLWMKASTVDRVTFTKEEIINFYGGLKYMPLKVTKDTDRSIKKALNPMGFTVTEGDQESLIQCLLHLRRIETLHEGLRWYDIKRYGIEIAHNRDGLEDDVLLKDDPRRAIQIPQDVISAGLSANPRK